MKHTRPVVATGLVALGTIGAVACASQTLKPPPGAAGSSASIPGISAPATTAPPAHPYPSPDGTYQGACDYTLGNDPANGTAVATGDIQTTNTGNIGIVIKLTLTWPQQGYSPLSETKTVSVPDGGSMDVQFNMQLTYDQLSNLQNWQSGHTDTGCTYTGTITGTFGVAQ